MLTLTQGANLGWFNFLDHFKTCLVKFPHGDFVDSANMMQRLRCLRGRMKVKPAGIYRSDTFAAIHFKSRCG